MSRYSDSRSRIIKINDNDDKIYYNIEVTNPIINPDGNIVNGKRATFTENRVQPIVDNPTDYYLTIARFEVSGSAIPIMIFPIAIGPAQCDVNLSALSVTFTYLGIDYQSFVNFVPQLPTEPTPLAPCNNNGLQAITPYYYIYNYQYFLDLVNTALAASFTALVTAVPALVPSAPYFVFNPETSLISLIVPIEYLNTVEIWLNSPLFTYFFGIPAFNFIANDLLNLNGRDYLVIVRNNTTNCFTPCGPSVLSTSTTNAGVTTTIGAPISFLRIEQEWVGIQYWNSFKSIIFVSPSIGCVNEYIPTSIASQQGGQVTFLPILTDFQPILDNPGDSRSQISYFPQGPYRLINLTGTIPLVHVDITAYWQDLNDAIHPIILLPGTYMAVKFLFIKKSSYFS